MKHFSKYVRVYKAGESAILFNTVNKAIVKVGTEWVIDGLLNESVVSADELIALNNMGFFISDTEGEQLARSRSSDAGRLSISIELSLACNLRCPYCYQGPDKNSILIPEEALLVVEAKVMRSLSAGGLREVVIKVLGGEPSITWHVVEPILKRIAESCVKQGVRFNLMIDTNGVYIDPFLDLSWANSVLFTIPLTHKSCHDAMRFDAQGKGTYETVVKNVEILTEKPWARIILRHNTDGDNYLLFSDYLDDLANTLSSSPLIDLSYTAQFDTTAYENSLSYEDFLRWRISAAVPALLERDMPVLLAPVMTQVPCQRLGEGSMKVFSDGTVGLCAMDFFKGNRLNARSALDGSLENHRDAIPEECMTCASFFVCAGSYHLPCIKALGYNECEADGAFNVNLEQFVKTYLEAGRPDLFPVFNQSIVVR